MIRDFFLIIFFYLLTLFQNSFLVHYFQNGNSVNLVLAFIIIIAFLENKKSKTGLLAAISGGFFLDIFSPYFFGLFLLLTLIIILLIKFLKPFFDSDKLVSFIIIDSIIFLLYEIVIFLLNVHNGLYFIFLNFLFNFFSTLIVYCLMRLGYVFIQKKI